MPSFEYRHVVNFEETSLIGNVYFTNYLLWQGHCRERFLHDHASGIIGELCSKEIAFFTRGCSCDFDGDEGFSALDEVLICMDLVAFRGGRMTLGFTYHPDGDPSAVVATGRQEVACKRRAADGTYVAAPFPVALVRALLPFAATEELRASLADTLEFLGGAKERRA